MYKLLKSAVGKDVGAAGRGSARRAAPRRSSKCCCRWLLPSVATMRSAVWIGVALMAVLGANSGVLRGLSSVTQAAGDFSNAAGQLAGAGANVTVKVSSIGIDALSTAQHAAGEFVYGVDLLGVTLHRTTLRMAGLSPGHLTNWLGKREDLPEPARSWYVAQVKDVSRGLPSFQASTEVMLANGSYSQLWIRVRFRCGGSAAAALVLAVVDFVPSWTNPSWDFFGFDVGSRHTQIVEQLKRSIGKLQEIQSNSLDIGDVALRDEFGLAPGWYCVLPRLPLLLAVGAVLGLGVLLFRYWPLALRLKSNILSVLRRPVSATVETILAAHMSEAHQESPATVSGAGVAEEYVSNHVAGPQRS